MVVHDAQHGGGIHALRGLGQVGVVHQIQIFAGNVADHLGSAEAELLQHEFSFRGRRALRGRGDVKTAFAVQISGGNGGNDAVGIGIHVTKN